MFDLFDRLLESVGRPVDFVVETSFGIARILYYMACVVMGVLVLIFAVGWVLSRLSS